MPNHGKLFHILYSFSCLLLFGVACLSTLVSSKNLTLNDHLITSLPGLTEKINFRQYAGYIPVAPTRKLFYWFVESSGKPSRDPLMIWLNGGPGCSSILGLLTENGPFYPINSNTLGINEHSWNRLANVLYIESPAGAGFSTAETEDDLKTGDTQSTNDLMVFLKEFFELHKDYKNHKIFLSGESYAGHYVPLLAQRILDNNNNNYNNSKLPINNSTDQVPSLHLEGLLVGNPWVSPSKDTAGAIQYWHSHQLISDATYQDLVSACLSKTRKLSKHGITACQQAHVPAQREMGLISPYNVYKDVCPNPQAELFLSLRSLTPMKKRALILPLDARSFCIHNELSIYMNRPDVQSALHIPSPGVPWTWCSQQLEYSDADFYSDLLPLYQSLTARLRMLVYSGDADAVCSSIGTRAWIRELGLTETQSWRAWMVDGQVGGYTVRYAENMTFATVRHAGHMVPEDQPRRAFVLVQQFLASEPLAL